MRLVDPMRRVEVAAVDRADAMVNDQRSKPRGR